MGTCRASGATVPVTGSPTTTWYSRAVWSSPTTGSANNIRRPAGRARARPATRPDLGHQCATRGDQAGDPDRGDPDTAAAPLAVPAADHLELRPEGGLGVLPEPGEVQLRHGEPRSSQKCADG